MKPRVLGPALVVGWALLVGATPAWAAGRIDPAPISDDVVKKVVHDPLRRHARRLPEQLDQKLDEILSLLSAIDEEDRSRPRTSSTDSSANRMLLGSKIHELGLLRTRIRDEAGRIRSMLVRSGVTAHVKAWDESHGRVEQQFERLGRLFGDVQQGGAKRRALSEARAELQSLRSRREAREPTPPGPPSPTMRHEPATFQQPDADDAPPPAYITSGPKPPKMYAFAGDELMLASAPVTGQEGICQYTADDLGQTAPARSETQITPELQALAERLELSPAKIYQYVANEIAFEPYYGSLKGATGTLYTKSGNATDQASLLMALLRASNIPARYVKGKIRFVNDPRLLRWVGAKDYPGAAKVLALGAIPTDPIGANQAVQFTHVWVEACVPYRSYRGLGIDTTGHRWIPLDPSFKDKAYQPGIAGIPDHVTFDYFPGFLSARGNALPAEHYATLVETYIKTLDANNTVTDVGYVGATIPRPIDVLPASLPYEVIQFKTWPGTFPASADIAEVSVDHRYQLEVIPEDGGTPEHDVTQFVASGSPIMIPPSRCGNDLYFVDFIYCVPSVVIPMPDVVLKRVTLSFKGSTADDQAVLDAWKTNPDQTVPLPCSKTINGVSSTVMVTPSVKVDGVESVLTSPMGPPPPSLGVCTSGHRVTLRIGLVDGGSGVNNRAFVPGVGRSERLNAIVFRNIHASDYHALLAYAFQTSDRLLTERAARVLQSVNTRPSPNTAQDQDETEGEFLNVVGLKYLRYLSDGIRTVATLDGGSGRSGTHLGLVSSRMKVSYVFDEPFAVYRTGLLVDVPGGMNQSVDITTGTPVWKTFQVAGYHGSNLESYVWQETARLDAVSTVRGLQFAHETGLTVLTLTPGSDINQLCSVGNPQQPAGCPADLLFSSQDKGTILSLIQPYDATTDKGGYTVTAPRQLIRYQNWTGSVWAAERSSIGSMSAIFAISGGFHGGFTVGDPISVLLAQIGSGATPPTGFNLALPPLVVNNVFVDDVTTVPMFDNGRQQGAGSLVTTAGDPVNMVTGNMYHVERDIAIKGRGLPIVFERSYNSRAAQDGPLGFGWTHSFNHRLVFNDDNADGVSNPADTDGVTSSVTWIDGTGSQKFVQVTGTTSGIAVGSTFVTPRGLFFQMAKDTNGYTIREKNGLTYRFDNVAGTVGQVARLTSITDRNGNALTLAYDTDPNPATKKLVSVTDGLGRSLTLTYNASGRIATIADWAGRTHEYGYDATGNLTSYKNPRARAGLQNPVTYSYYATAPFTHAMQAYTLPRGNGMTFEYYQNGKVFRHSTTLGETTTFTYNDVRRETIQTNERGHTRHFLFDEFGNPTQIVEENSGTWTYTYDAPANPLNRVSQRDPLGYVTTYAYDANGNVTRMTLPSGNTVDYGAFNSFNQPGKVKDARGNFTLLKYDVSGNLIQTVRLKNGLGAALDPTTFVPSPGDGTASAVAAWTINTYGGFGNVLTTKRVLDAATSSGPTGIYDYNDTANGIGLNVVAITRRNADGTTYAISPPLTYDSLGRIRQGLRSDWYPTQAQYDPPDRDVDRVVRGTDDFTKLRDFVYDANGNLTSVSLTDASGAVVDQTTLGYDLSDRKLSAMDAGGFITNFQYDPAGNVIAVTNPDGFTLRFDYDPMQRVTRATDQEGNAVTRTLDLMGKPRTVTDPNGNTVSYSYYGPERDGRLKTKTEPIPAPPNARTTTYDYDANGNVIKITGMPSTPEPSGRTTLTTYDELNRPVRVAGPVYTDSALGTIRPLTIYTYDLLGRLIRIEAGRTDATGTNPSSDSVSRQMSYGWDDFGRKTSESDGAGRTWTFVPDLLHGTVQQVTDPKGQITRFDYDPDRRFVRTRTDQAGRVTTFTPNDLGQLAGVQGPDVTYTYGYDLAHRLTSVLDSRGNKTVSYTWSPGGLLNTMLDSEGNRTDYVYDPAGRLAEVWAPNGDLVSFLYDAGGRLTQKWFPNGASTQYTYNADNTLARVLNTVPGTTSPRATISQHDYTYDAVGNRQTHTELIAGVTTPYQYTYDLLSRLTAVTNTATATTESYTYDPLGNRTSKTSGTTTLTYTYDPQQAQQLTEIRQGVTLVGGLVYDANGNLVKKCEGAGVTRTDLDCSGATVTTLTYDTLNRMTVATKTGQADQRYVYDDQGRRIQKTVGTATTNYLYDGLAILGEYASGWTAPTATYTHGAGTDVPLIRITATGARYYHQDGLGSVVALTTATGATPEASARYDAWGNTIASTGTLPLYGYTGREPDETGLIYYRARYYDPTTGRFAQRDPVGLVGGINPYLYAAANPVNFTDPLGTSPSNAALGNVASDTSYFNADTSDAASSLTAGTQSLSANRYRATLSSAGIVTRVDQITDESVQPIIAINGIRQDLDSAVTSLARQIRATDNTVTSFDLFHVPDEGPIGDAVNTLRDKLGFTTALAQDFARMLLAAQASGEATRVFAYSRGGAILAQAVNVINATGGGQLSNISVQCSGCANNILVSGQIFAQAGITSVNYKSNSRDFVSNLFALNTLNPARIVGSLLSIPLLFAPPPLNPHVYP